MEYIDAYDDNNKFIGSFKRDTVHREGMWHNTFQCWVVRNVRDKQLLLFQKRHPSKDTFPNLFDTSSAGHLTSGESARDGVRELKEELGIDISFEDLTFLGNMTQVKRGENYIDREICNIFVISSNLEPENYNIQKEELCGLIEVDLKEFEELIENAADSVHAAGFEVDEQGKRIIIDRDLKRSEFVPHDKEYYSFVIDNIKRVQG